MNKSAGIQSTFFSPLLPEEELRQLLSLHPPQDQKKMTDELITLCNYIVLSEVLQTMDSVSDRSAYVDTFIFRYTDTDYFETFSREFSSLIPVLSERLERAILSIITTVELEIE